MSVTRSSSGILTIGRIAYRRAGGDAGAQSASKVSLLLSLVCLICMLNQLQLNISTRAKCNLRLPCLKHFEHSDECDHKSASLHGLSVVLYVSDLASCEILREHVVM